MKNIAIIFVVQIAMMVFLPIASYAEKAAYLNDLEEFINSEVKALVSSDKVIRAVQEQNVENEDMITSEMRVLENKWSSERRKKKRPLSKMIKEANLSVFLAKVKEKSGDIFTEIVVTDSNGITVGQSGLSENYWYGRQNVWKQTFESRSYSTYISDLYFNDHTGLFQVDVAMMIVYDDNPIGMLFMGIDVELIN